MGVGQMDGIGDFMLDLHAVKPGALANADFGDAVGEIAAFADMGFDQRGGGAGAISMTLRVAMVRGAASVAMKTSSTGVSMVPESTSRAPSVAKAAFICMHRFGRRRRADSTALFSQLRTAGHHSGR